MIEGPIAARAEGGGAGWFFNHLPDILWQRRLILVGTFLFVFLAGAIAAFVLPTIYRSTATMLVQSQDLPSQLVESPVSSAIDQRIARIRERVLSRGDLVSLIEQNDLYPEERRSKPLSKVVEKMRNATSVSALQNDIGNNNATSQQSNTIAVTMTFDYPEPAKAQTVLQSYVSNFLRMDSDDLEDQANISVRFLQDQAGKLQRQIRELEGQLTALKARNGAVLATSAPPMMDTGGYTAQIASLESQNRQLLAQSRRPERDPLLAQAEAAYAAARATYNDSHPDVAAARERLEQLRSVSRSSSGSEDTALLREQIAANNAAIASLTNARNSAVARAGAAMAGQARAPAILEQAMQLESRASSLREQYRDVASNLLRAQNSARMANEQRAERLSLVEPPDMPDRPFSPNRPLLIAAAAAAGLALGLILALGAELLSRPVRSPAQLEGLGFPVLGVVPTLSLIEKPRRTWFKKRAPALAR